MRLLLALAGFAIGFVSPTFAQDTIDPKVEQQIRVLAAKYDEAFNKNDASALGALFSEDAVFSGLHGTFNGRQAIENFHNQHVFARWHVNNRVRTASILGTVMMPTKLTPHMLKEAPTAQVFARWHVNNRVTTVDRVVSVSDEVSSSGRWSETVRSNGKNVGGTGW
jgi:uncharacterized protein (TIGR02246 family)